MVRYPENRPVEIDVIGGTAEPGSDALQPFAVGLVVREAAMNLENADLMTGHVPNIDRVLLGIAPPSVAPRPAAEALMSLHFPDEAAIW